MLTHPTVECHCPAEYKQCGICGIPGHTQVEHTAKHCRRLHPTLKCDCDPVCFNCTYRKLPTKGHYTFRDDCPLKKNMRHFASEPMPPHPAGSAPPPTTPAHVAAAIVNAPTQATL